LLLAFALLGAWNLNQRSLLLVDVLRDRGALLRETADGQIENPYTLKLMNLAEEQRDFTVEVSGLPGLAIVGQHEFSAEAGSIRPVSLTVAMPAESAHSGIQPINFRITAKQEPTTQVVEKNSFALP
jgi:polyferredoxin